MSFQAYLDTIRTRTGKGPDEFAVLAREAGCSTYKDVMAWLKADHGLGHGHANVIAQLLTRKDAATAPQADRLEALFSGGKAVWRGPFDALIEDVVRFGPDVVVAANRTYVVLNRGAVKFGIIEAGSATRLDVGAKLKGVAPEGIAENAGAWNAMVTHRIQLTDPDAIPQEVVDWLRRAYLAAGQGRA